MSNYSILFKPKGEDRFTLQCDKFERDRDYLILEDLPDRSSEVVCLRNIIWYNVKQSN